jgi:hypothetical protein
MEFVFFSLIVEGSDSRHSPWSGGLIKFARFDTVGEGGELFVGEEQGLLGLAVTDSYALRFTRHGDAPGTIPTPTHTGFEIPIPYGKREVFSHRFLLPSRKAQLRLSYPKVQI